MDPGHPDQRDAQQRVLLRRAPIHRVSHRGLQRLHELLHQPGRPLDGLRPDQRRAGPLRPGRGLRAERHPERGGGPQQRYLPVAADASHADQRWHGPQLDRHGPVLHRHDRGPQSVPLRRQLVAAHPLLRRADQRGAGQVRQRGRPQHRHVLPLGVQERPLRQRQRRVGGGRRVAGQRRGQRPGLRRLQLRQLLHLRLRARGPDGGGLAVAVGNQQTNSWHFLNGYASNPYYSPFDA